MKLGLTREVAIAAAELHAAFPCYAVAVTFHHDGTPRYVLTARYCGDGCTWWCLVGADLDEIKRELASGKAAAS